MLDRMSEGWRKRPWLSAGAAGVLAFGIYELTQQPDPQIYNQYVRLADAFLAGRVHLIDPPSWLELAHLDGKAYSHQGVLPALLMTPLVAVFGVDLDQRHVAAVLGAVIAVLAWILATRLGLSGRERLMAWALPVLGTTLWYEAKTGHTWGVAALVSALFLFAALCEYFGLRRLWLVGLLVGLAGLARPPAFLALVGLALAVRRPTAMFRLGLGALGPIGVMLGYNLARFGTLVDRSQELHYWADDFRHHRPPGQFSPAHIPHNLYSWFVLGPEFQETFPYLRPRYLGTAITFTSPAVVVGVAARRERWLWVAAGAVVVPAMLHYANGFSQFGMRYLLDAVPFLTALVALALRDGRAHVLWPLLVASVAFNLLGVMYTNAFALQ